MSKKITIPQGIPVEDFFSEFDKELSRNSEKPNTLSSDEWGRWLISHIRHDLNPGTCMTHSQASIVKGLIYRHDRIFNRKDRTFEPWFQARSNQDAHFQDEYWENKKIEIVSLINSFRLNCSDCLAPKCPRRDESPGSTLEDVEKRLEEGSKRLIYMS